MSERLYRVEDLSFSYGTNSRRLEVLHGLNFQVDNGQMMLIMGPSGSGKSTLLNLLGLIEPMQKGRIFFGEEEFSHMSERSKNRLRRHKIGFVFQSFLLFDVLTVEENLSYFLTRQGIKPALIDQRIDATLEKVGLPDKKHVYPGELSGGQRQRVAIARAIIKEPDVIIADEPTANLDQANSHEIFSLLQSLTQNGCTLIMASHDGLARSYASRTLFMRDGTIQSQEVSS